jgi:hypothetical protein
MGSLLAVWLLGLLSMWSAEPLPDPERQAYVWSAEMPSVADQSDVSSPVYGYEAVALVSPHSGFSFLPALVFLPSLLSGFYRCACIALPGRLSGSYFSFGFLLPIFEHQIAINAP